MEWRFLSSSWAAEEDAGEIGGFGGGGFGGGGFSGGGGSFGGGGHREAGDMLTSSDP